VNDHIPDATKMISDTPISDSTPHNVADLAMLCRRFERFAAGREAYIKQLETENDAMRADLLLWRDTTDAMCSKAGIGFTTEDKP
jgi:hypothetical protein